MQNYAEWLLVAPLRPPPAKTGRRRSWEMRELINAIFFALRGAASTGPACRPKPGCPSKPGIVREKTCTRSHELEG
jgi:transposase